MTTPTTSPVLALEYNLKELETSQEHVSRLVRTAREDMERRRVQLQRAEAYYQQRCKEIEVIEAGMKEHQDAINKLMPKRLGPSDIDEEDEFERPTRRDEG